MDFLYNSKRVIAFHLKIVISQKNSVLPLHSAFIYEPILIRIYMYADIMKTQ